MRLRDLRFAHRSGAFRGAARRGTEPSENGKANLDEVLAERIRGSRGTRPESPRISIVIPALNEAESLLEVLPRIDPHLDEVLLIDGDSEDETVELARRLHPRMRVVSQRDSGKGEALRRGFDLATGDIIVTLDADGSTDPAEIPAFVGALLAGADFAKGSRFLQGSGTDDMPLLRRLGNWFFVRLVRLLFRGRYSDLCYGYNDFWKDVLPALQLDANGFEIETMMNIRALKARLKVVEVASFEKARTRGTPKLKTFSDGWRVLKTIFRERFRPMRADVPRAEAPELGGGEWTPAAGPSDGAVVAAPALPDEA